MVRSAGVPVKRADDREELIDGPLGNAPDPRVLRFQVEVAVSKDEVDGVVAVVIVVLYIRDGGLVMGGSRVLR